MMHNFAIVENRRTVGIFLIFLSCFQLARGQCFRSMRFLIATEEYQEFTSPGYPLYYYTSRSCSWRLYASNSSHAIRLDVLDCSIEYGDSCQYDFCQVFDGDTISHPSLGVFCGTSRPTFISTNESMMFYFSSDSSVTSRGFKARYKAGPRSSLFEDVADSSNLGTIVGAVAGCAAFVVIVTVIGLISYKHFKGKKKVTAQVRPCTSVRVRPRDDDDVLNYFGTYFPPSYEEVGASPPLGYCGSNNYVNHDHSAESQRINVKPGVRKLNEEKAPWRKEPLETIQGLHLGTNTGFCRPRSRQETLTNIGISGPRYSLAGSSGINRAGPSSVVLARVQSGTPYKRKSEAPNTHTKKSELPQDEPIIAAYNNEMANDTKPFSEHSRGNMDNGMNFRQKTLKKTSNASNLGCDLSKKKPTANTTLKTYPTDKHSRNVTSSEKVTLEPDETQGMADDMQSITSEVSL